MVENVDETASDLNDISAKETFRNRCQVMQEVRQACVKDPSVCPYAKHSPRCLGSSGLDSKANKGEMVWVAIEAPAKSAVTLALQVWLEEKTRSASEIADAVRQQFEALTLLHHLDWVDGSLCSLAFQAEKVVTFEKDTKLWLELPCVEKYTKGKKLTETSFQCIPNEQRPPEPERTEDPRKTIFGVDLWCAGALLKDVVEKVAKTKSFTVAPSGSLKPEESMASMEAIIAGLREKQPSKRTTVRAVLENHFNVSLPPFFKGARRAVKKFFGRGNLLQLRQQK